MTVVNFLCRKENTVMRKKIKIAGLAIVLLTSSLLIQQGIPTKEPLPPPPHICPVSEVAVSYRENTPTLLTIKPISKKAIDHEETSSAKIAKTSSPQPTEKEEADLPSTPPTQTATKPPPPTQSKTGTPEMGDTRIVNGQKQVYFLGFGWIEDNDEPNHGSYVEGMYENGNIIGIMGGGPITGESYGDINKMVGIMD